MDKDHSLVLCPYLKQEKQWPQKGQCILAQFDEQSIVVYQAYKPEIANAIVKHQNYHHEECLAKGLSLNRMTWVKTNFLWMMFRSGWATKHNQERILAIRISKKGFEQILVHAYHSIMKTNKFPQKVRLQWDPDHQPNGDKVNSGRRAIQLGLPPGLLLTLSKQFIIKIEDVTCVAQAGRENLNKLQELLTPHEKVYEIKDKQLRDKIING